MHSISEQSETDSRVNEEQQEVPKRRKRVVAIFVGLLLLVLLGIDFFAGWLLIPPSQQSQFRCPHPYFHHGFFPLVETVTQWSSRRYNISTNSLGLRDSEPRTIINSPDRPRLVVIGDSFTEGLGVNFDKSFCGRMREHFAHEREVINAGTVSYSPKLYYLKIRYLVDQGLEFDHLMVMIDISDIQDETFYESFQPRETISMGTRADAFLFRRSFLYHSAAKMIDSRRQISNEFDVNNVTADFDVWKNSGQLPKKLDRDERFGWTTDPHSLESWAKDGLDLATQNMNRLAEFCDDNNITLMVGVYPSPHQIFTSDLNSVQVKHWSEFCDDREIPFVNLFPAFINESFRGPREVYDRYFIHSDVHWNEAGHQLVADELAKFFTNNTSSESEVEEVSEQP